MKAKRLSERVMLTSLSTHEWTGKKKDKAMSQIACSSVNAEKDVVEAIISLAPPGELQPINVARSRVYRRFVELTLPWMDGGLRILPADMYLKYRDEMNKVIAAHTEAVNAFATRWPEIVANKDKRLGSLASKYRLPTVAELKGKFYIKQDIFPLPETADFRVDISQNEADEIRTQVAASLDSASNKAMCEVWNRLSNLVNDVAETMVQKDKKFRDSLIKKLKDFCATIPKYNITDNADLENVRKEVLTKLANLNPEDLREIPNNRKKAAKDAKDVLDRIKDYMKQ